MPDVAVLGIKVENGQVEKAVTSLDKMTVAGGKTEAAIGRVGRRMGLAEIEARRMDAAMSAQARTSTGLFASLEKMSGAAKAMASGMALAVATMAVHEVIELTNAYTNLSNKLRLVTADAENRAAVERALFGVSQRTRSELEGNVALYSSLARSTKALGLSQAELVAITETVAGAMAVGGASASEQASSIRQLSQAFASGVLRGDEFNSMAENAPRLQELLAKSLGVSIGQLRAMAEQGLLTSDVLAKAFLDGGATVKAEVEGMALSISGAMTQIKNAVLVYVGAVDDANGASRSIAEALSGVADNIPTVLGWWGKLIEVMLMYWRVVIAAGTATKNLFSGNAGANAGVLDDLTAKWEALMKAPNSGAAAGAVSTTRGSGSGVAATAAEIARAAREAKAAAREAEQQKKKEERDAERDAKKAEDYAKDLQDIWDRGMEDIVASTERGFRAMLESMQSLVGKMLDRMAKEGQTNTRLGMAGIAIGGGLAGYNTGQSLYSSSHGAAGNYSRGAVGGAASGAMAGAALGSIVPGIGTAVGAIIGGAAGFVGGVLGMASASKEAAKQMAEAQKAISLSMAALRADVNHDTVAAGIAAIEADREQRRRAIEDAYSGGGANSEQVRKRNAALAEMNALENERIRQLKEEFAQLQQRFAEDLQVRLLSAQGHTGEADALRLQLAQQREMQDAIKNGADPATLALLEQVQAQEKLAAATNAATSAALNMVSGYKLQAAIFQAIGPRDFGSPENPFIPVNPGTRSNSVSAGGDLHVTVMTPNGDVLGKAVLKDFQRRAQISKGDTSRWSEIQS